MTRRARIGLAFVLLACSASFAQAQAGTISGRVTDAAGAPISGVRIVLSRAHGSQPIATLTTPADGYYRFNGLEEGKYRLTAEGAGYREVLRDNIELTAQSDARIDLTLVPEPASHQQESALAQAGYYEGTPLKPAQLSGSIDPGGYSSAGQAEKNRRLLEGAARFNEAPGGSPSGKAPASDRALAETELKLKRAVQSAPQSFEANANLGEFYIHTSRLSAAIPHLMKAYLLNPGQYANAYDLALAYLETRDYAAARDQVHSMLKSAAVDRRQDAAELHNLLGEIEERSGNYLEAVNEYERAAHLEPTEKNIFDWGLELLTHQTLEPAIEVFRAGAQRYPSSSQLRVGYGIALYSRGKYDDAVEALLQATDLNAADPRPYSFLAQVYGVSPTHAGAVADRLRRFAELQPNNAQALYSYALALWKGRREEDRPAVEGEVESLLKKAAALDPRFAGPHLELGALYAARKQYSEAIREYQQAIKLGPDLPDAHYRLGQALARSGDQARAQEEFQSYERLHKQQVADQERQRTQVQQFVLKLQEGSK